MRCHGVRPAFGLAFDPVGVFAYIHRLLKSVGDTVEFSRKQLFAATPEQILAWEIDNPGSIFFFRHRVVYPDGTTALEIGTVALM
jgi:hypothetical protein